MLELSCGQWLQYLDSDYYLLGIAANRRPALAEAANLLDIGGWKREQPCCRERELYLRLLIGARHLAITP